MGKFKVEIVKTIQSRSTDNWVIEEFKTTTVTQQKKKKRVKGTSLPEETRKLCKTLVLHHSGTHISYTVQIDF